MIYTVCIMYMVSRHILFYIYRELLYQYCGMTQEKIKLENETKSRPISILYPNYTRGYYIVCYTWEFDIIKF